MSYQVVIGKLASPYEVFSDKGKVEIKDWQGKAKWSYLRLVYGRKIDETIKAVKDKEKREQLMNSLIQKSLSTAPTLQYILNEKSQVCAVATLKHLIIPPEQVYATAENILGRLYTEGQIYGKIAYMREVAGIKIGYQIYAGTITTREAIRVSAFARVELCLNPLSWLGSSFFGWFIDRSGYERILRIKKITDLEPRLKTAIEKTSTKLNELEKRTEEAKKDEISDRTAKILASAMSLSYGLGAKIINQVLERYQDEEPTRWGLAMAESWVAKHGKHRKTPEGQQNRVPQKLSTISGATLLIDDTKKAEKKALEWLKSHIKKGELKTLDQLLRDIL